MKRLANGTELTPELEARIVAKFEHGLDLRKAKIVTGGPGTPGLRRRRVVGPSPRVSVRLTPEMHERLRREARTRGIKLATLMRERLAAKA